MPCSLPILSYSTESVSSGDDLQHIRVHETVVEGGIGQSLVNGDEALSEKVSLLHTNEGVVNGDEALREKGSLLHTKEGVVNGIEESSSRKVVAKGKKPFGSRTGKSILKQERSRSVDGTSTSKLIQGQKSDGSVRVASHAQSVKGITKAIFEVQLLLLDTVQTRRQLHAASAILTKSEYADVVTERSISKFCGHPTCQNRLSDDDSRKARYRISLKEKKVYDLREVSLYCSSFCQIASKTFSAGLLEERNDVVDAGRLLNIVNAVRGAGVSELFGVDKCSGEGTVHDQFRSLRVEERHHTDVAVSSLEGNGDPYAVEGYTPLTSSRGSRREKKEISSVKVHFKDADCTSKVTAASSNSRLTAVTETPLEEESSNLSNAGRIGKFDESDLICGDFFPCLLEKTDERATAGHNQSFVELKPALSNVRTHKRSQSCSSFIRSNVEQVTDQKKLGPGELKSALKRTTGRCHHRSVSWVDQQELDIAVSAQREVLQQEGKDSSADAKSISPEDKNGCVVKGSISSSPAERSEVLAEVDSENRGSARLYLAEAVAAALTEAATAAVEGKLDGHEASEISDHQIVMRAGLSVIPASSFANASADSAIEVFGGSEIPRAASSNGSSSLESWDVSWPMPQSEAAEEDDFSFKDGWHDAPPKDFKVEVSTFGTIWMALEEWISAAAIAHIYGKEVQEQEEFLLVNGREYARQMVHEDGISAEISRLFSICLSRALPDVVQALRLNLPVSTLEQAIGRLIRSMTFREALPPFGTKQWRMVAVLVLDALSVQQLAYSGSRFFNNRVLLRKVLESTGTSDAEYDTFLGLLLPLGRLPGFATLSGG